MRRGKVTDSVNANVMRRSKVLDSASVMGRSKVLDTKLCNALQCRT